MAKAPDWTPDEDTYLRELAGQGYSYRRIAEEFKAAGTPKTHASIQRAMRRLGIQVDRSQTIAATQALVIDAKARRAKLAIDLLKDAEKLRQQVFAPSIAFAFGGRDNTYAEHPLDRPIPSDQLKLIQAAGAAIDRSLKLDLHDADGGHTEAIGMLDGIVTAINAAADRVETEQAAR